MPSANPSERTSSSPPVMVSWECNGKKCVTLLPRYEVIESLESWGNLLPSNERSLLLRVIGDGPVVEKVVVSLASYDPNTTGSVSPSKTTDGGSLPPIRWQAPPDLYDR